MRKKRIFFKQIIISYSSEEMCVGVLNIEFNVLAFQLSLQFHFLCDQNLIYTISSISLKLVSAIFIKCLFFYQMIAFKKLWKMFFVSSKKLFLFSRYWNFCVFSPFLSTPSRFRRTNRSGIIYDVMNWLA